MFAFPCTVSPPCAGSCSSLMCTCCCTFFHILDKWLPLDHRAVSFCGSVMPMLCKSSDRTRRSGYFLLLHVEPCAVLDFPCFWKFFHILDKQKTPRPVSPCASTCVGQLAWTDHISSRWLCTSYHSLKTDKRSFHLWHGSHFCASCTQPYLWMSGHKYNSQSFQSQEIFSFYLSSVCSCFLPNHYHSFPLHLQNRVHILLLISTSSELWLVSL